MNTLSKYQIQLKNKQKLQASKSPECQQFATVKIQLFEEKSVCVCVCVCVLLN